MPTTKLVVNVTDAPSFDMRVGTGVLDSLGLHLRTVPALDDTLRLVVVSDGNVAPLYGAKVKTSLKYQGFAASEITLPAEAPAGLAVVEELWAAFAQLGLTKTDAVVALGGASVLNLAGFAAATYLEGIPAVFVPTTLSAAVDCAVSGKVGFPVARGRRAGVLARPAYVCCDLNTFGSLSAEQWTAGLAWVAAAAMASEDDNLFWLMEQADTLRTVDCVTEAPLVAMEMVARAAVARADVMGEDPTDALGMQVAYRYGRSLATALADATENELSGGYALAQGMRAAAVLSVEVAQLDPDIADAQNQLLEALGLERVPVAPDAAWKVAEALNAATKGSVPQLILLQEVGMAAPYAVDQNAIAAALMV